MRIPVIYIVSLYYNNKRNNNMKKNKKRRNPPSTPLAAFHKGSRDAEISAFNKPVPHHKIVESKKVYRRNRRVEL